jgi:DNA (cytosine-5)-methyltransferase 1
VLKQDLSTAPQGYVLERLAELPRMRKPVGVIGGPPCQAFSMSNRNGGSRDARANLPENYAAVLKELATAFELIFSFSKMSSASGTRSIPSFQCVQETIRFCRILNL